jgi:hypothetical protein
MPKLQPVYFSRKVGFFFTPSAARPAIYRVKTTMSPPLSTSTATTSVTAMLAF